MVFSSTPAAADRGLLRHDDLVAGQRRQHGMALDRLGQIGHRGGRVEFFAGEELGQFEGVAEAAAAAALAGTAGYVELEDQHRPDASRRAWSSAWRHGRLHARNRFVVQQRQGNADHLAELLRRCGPSAFPPPQRRRPSPRYRPAGPGRGFPRRAEQTRPQPQRDQRYRGYPENAAAGDRSGWAGFITMPIPDYRAAARERKAERRRGRAEGGGGKEREGGYGWNQGPKRVIVSRHSSSWCSLRLPPSSALRPSSDADRHAAGLRPAAPAARPPFSISRQSGVDAWKGSARLKNCRRGSLITTLSNL